jgi:hypothetical protein
MAVSDRHDGAAMSLDDVVGENGPLIFCSAVEVRRGELRDSIHGNAGSTLIEDGTIRDLVMPGRSATR